jgi:hypothetical protein
MYCKNCGNEFNENAVACLKCGCDPKKGNKNCPSCGVETNPNQVICVKCGGSLKKESFNIDTSSLGTIDTTALLKNKQLILALVALIGYFLPWVSGGRRMSVSGSGIAQISEYVPGGELLSLLFLFPLCLVGIIASNFVPQILKFKKILSISSIVLVCYALLAIIMLMDKYGKFDIGIIGFGFYVSLIGSIASAFFGSKKE